MGAVRFVLQTQLRRTWRPLAALALLVALAGGLVLAAVTAGRRTASAFPDFVAAHGYDALVFNNTALPDLSRLPEVASARPAIAVINGQPTCTCPRPVDANLLEVLYLPSRDLHRAVNLVSGRWPDESDPSQVLASFTLGQANGIHVGTVIRVPLYAASQADAVFNSLGAGPDPSGPTGTFHVVGMEAAEPEFPTGGQPVYDIFTTTAFAHQVLPRTTTALEYLVRLKSPSQSLGFKPDVKALSDQANLAALATPAALVQGSIHPQAVGWWVLAALVGLAGLVAVGQALSRSAAGRAEQFETMSALGLAPPQLALLGAGESLLVGMVGAAGAVGLAYLLSPLAPVGEARLAEARTGLRFDWPALLLGALAVVTITFVLGLAPAIREARRPGRAPASPVRLSLLPRLLGLAGWSPSAAVGIRHALERGGGRGTTPVGSALLGSCLAVAALSGTAIFGASLANLTRSPALFGDNYQLIVYSGNGVPPSALESDLERQPGVADVTVGTGAPVIIHGTQIQALAGTRVKGSLLVTTLAGSYPSAPDQIAFGTATMRQLGLHAGDMVPVRFPSAHGADTVRMKVTGTVALPTGLGANQFGLGRGAAITLDGYFRGICPAGPGQVACLAAERRKLDVGLLVRTEPGRTGRAALAHLEAKYQSNANPPGSPTGLVNFGEAVNFPLIFEAILVVFGLASLGHLLLVSLVRRRHEMGLLKSLGFLQRQVGAVVYWQASTVAVIGVVIGVPLGLAGGREVWRAFALNVGVVPVPVVDPLLISALALASLIASGILAAAPALIASRSRPAQLLRAN